MSEQKYHKSNIGCNQMDAIKDIIVKEKNEAYENGLKKANKDKIDEAYAKGYAAGQDDADKDLRIGVMEFELDNEVFKHSKLSDFITNASMAPPMFDVNLGFTNDIRKAQIEEMHMQPDSSCKIKMALYGRVRNKEDINKPLAELKEALQGIFF